MCIRDRSLPLSNQQWQLLPSDSALLRDIKVELSEESTGNTWSAKVNRFEQHIGSNNRQRALIASVERPIESPKPLFPGTFIKASINGKAVEALWKLPASALINNNTVWQVSDDNLLVHLPVRVMFSHDNIVYVQPIEQLTQAKIVNRPLASYLLNMKVETKTEETI